MLLSKYLKTFLAEKIKNAKSYCWSVTIHTAMPMWGTLNDDDDDDDDEELLCKFFKMIWKWDNFCWHFYGRVIIIKYYFPSQLEIFFKDIRMICLQIRKLLMKLRRSVSVSTLKVLFNEIFFFFFSHICKLSVFAYIHCNISSR
mgnify:CR=1 FL=1